MPSRQGGRNAQRPEIIRDHVFLSISCIHRLYVNGYMPALRTSGQLCDFMRRLLGQPIPSPAVLRPLHDRFVGAVEDFAGRGGIPLVGFGRGQRKDDLVNARRARFDKREGVVMIGVAQERAWSFRAELRAQSNALSRIDADPRIRELSGRVLRSLGSP